MNSEAAPEYAKPLPGYTPLTAPFFDGTIVGEFRLQQCDECGTHRYPPVQTCPQCLSKECTWVATSGRGTVWSWIRLHRPYFAAFKEDLPYNVIIVQLEEGPMITSRYSGDEEELRCDLPVHVTFERVTDRVAIPTFTAAT